MTGKPPLKIAILLAVASRDRASCADVLRILMPDYGTERQCRPAVVDNHLHSLRAVGLIETCGAEPDAAGNINAVYRITPAGRARLGDLD